MQMTDYLHFMQYSNCKCPEALRKIAEALGRMGMEHSAESCKYHEQAEVVLQGLSEALQGLSEARKVE